MSDHENRTLLEDLLARGVDDWVYAAEVHDIARRSSLVEPDLVRMLAIGLIAEALSRGLMAAGDFDGSSHRPWECSVGEAIARIQDEWLGWGTEAPTPGAIVWLDVTPAGREIGERVLAREQTPH